MPAVGDCLFLLLIINKYVMGICASGDYIERCACLCTDMANSASLNENHA